FIGDESVAIITQHLNTPPVAPSWHTPSLPPGLEILILRLLEKDPAKRPASAADVRKALGGIDVSGAGSAPGSATPSAEVSGETPTGYGRTWGPERPKSPGSCPRCGIAFPWTFVQRPTIRTRIVGACIRRSWDSCPTQAMCSRC